MKMRKVLPVMLMMATVLTGCAKEVSYAEFHEAALKAKADENVKVTVSASGGTTVNGLYVEFNANNSVGKFTKGALGYTPDNDCPLAIAILGKAQLARIAALVEEGSTSKYYLDGEKYKVVDGNYSWQWNEYGYITTYKTNQCKITYKYSK